MGKFISSPRSTPSTPSGVSNGNFIKQAPFVASPKKGFAIFVPDKRPVNVVAYDPVQSSATPSNALLNDDGSTPLLNDDEKTIYYLLYFIIYFWIWSDYS